jgi:hypothetical protein
MIALFENVLAARPTNDTAYAENPKLCYEQRGTP